MDPKKQLSVAVGVGALAVLVALWLLQSNDGQAFVTSKFSTTPLVSDSGLRMDNDWQDCEGSNFKKAFPDLDYALYGYDILTGYPMTTGRDPGFTHPIFKADYSSSKQTSDCRYSVPRGVNAVPSEACVVSFESRLLRNKEEMDSSLGGQAQVSGGGWGFEFSASASYKSNSAKMSAGDNFFIISHAKCDHYFSTIDFSNPPPFDPGFLAWADNLTIPNAEYDERIGEFIKYYGTHFLSDVTFGAKFIQQHKMSQATYANYKDSAISVEAQASYAGLISVGAGFSLTEEQRNAAERVSLRMWRPVQSRWGPLPQVMETL